jgi:hypothetical protein
MGSAFPKRLSSPKSYGATGFMGLKRLSVAQPITFHFSPLTSHSSRHGRGLYLRFAFLQLGDLSRGGGDLGFT